MCVCMCVYMQKLSSFFVWSALSAHMPVGVKYVCVCVLQCVAVCCSVLQCVATPVGVKYVCVYVCVCVCMCVYMQKLSLFFVWSALSAHTPVGV